MGMGAAGPRAGRGWGGVVAFVGLGLVSPVGEWLMKGTGWSLIFLGICIAVTGVYYWIRGPRRGGYL